MPPDSHRSLLKAAQQAFASAQLAWLRNGRQEHGFSTQLERLLSERGVSLFDTARRDRSYSLEEEPLVARHIGYLAAQASLLEARPLAAQLLTAPIAIGYDTELPNELVSQLLLGGGEDRGPALATALEPFASRWVDVRCNAARAFRTQLKAFTIKRAVTPSEDRDAAEHRERERAAAARLPRQLVEAHAAASLVWASPLERAACWLDATDDAARDMVRWLIRSAATSEKERAVAWPTLFAALRAAPLDGLARPSRRFFRLSEGARRLGFERDMGSRMRAESSISQLGPRAICIPLSVPDDIRIAQPALEYGVLSDLVATQGIGESLALALISPALTDVLRAPSHTGVSATVGALLMQLRAEPAYLARLEGHSPDIAERLARHAAIFVLLRTRLSAALFIAEQSAGNSEPTLLPQLMAATERALACQLPSGLTGLCFMASALEGADFEAAECAFTLHAALRERFDDDWFLNPRVSEVLRGACARGNLLSGPAFCDECSAQPELSIARALEILG